MSKVERFQPEFRETVPDRPQAGVLYVSIVYTTAVHLCACGCGLEVVTPLSPRDWKLVFDGETVSLLPSVGNWGIPCQSHYWIKSNRVQWARKWSLSEIQAARARNARLRSYGRHDDTPPRA